MTIDHSSDFDARRVGWRQRRSAARRVKKAAGITPADRELRVQQAKAAQTRGELNALTRGLDVVGGAPAARTYVPPPASAPRAGLPPQMPLPPGYANHAPQAPRRSSSLGSKLVIGLVVLVLFCGASLVSCVSALVDSVSEISSRDSSSSSPDLGTEDGWDDMVDAFGDETDLSRTVLLSASHRSATLSVEADARTADRFYFDGDVTAAGPVQRVPAEQTFDLAEIDASVVVGAVARARRSSGVTDSTQASVLISAAGAGPRIYVTFPDGTAGSYSLLVDVEGGVVAENP